MKAEFRRLSTSSSKYWQNLSEPLCFIFSKLGKAASKLIKSVVLDYYKPEDISEAKVRLLEDISQLNTSEKIPHVSKRRDGDNKTAISGQPRKKTYTLSVESKNIQDQIMIALQKVKGRQHGGRRITAGLLKSSTAVAELLKTDQTYKFLQLSLIHI